MDRTSEFWKSTANTPAGVGFVHPQGVFVNLSENLWREILLARSKGPGKMAFALEYIMELRDRLSALKAHPGTLRVDECLRVPVMRILCESLEQFARDIRAHEGAVAEFKAMCAAELDLRREHRFRIPQGLFEIDDVFRWRPGQQTPESTCESAESSDEASGWGVDLFDDAVRAATFDTPRASDTPTAIALAGSKQAESEQVTAARQLIMTTLQRDSSADVVDVQRRLLEITDIVSTFAQKLDAQQEMEMSIVAQSEDAVENLVLAKSQMIKARERRQAYTYYVALGYIIGGLILLLTELLL